MLTAEMQTSASIQSQPSLHDGYYEMLRKTSFDVDEAADIWNHLVAKTNDSGAEKYLDSLIHPEPKDPRFEKIVRELDEARRIVTVTEAEVLAAIPEIEKLYQRVPESRPLNDDMMQDVIERIAQNRFDAKLILSRYWDKEWYGLGIASYAAIDKGMPEGGRWFWSEVQKSADEKNGKPVHTFKNSVRSAPWISCYGDYVTPGNRAHVEAFDALAYQINGAYEDGALTMDMVGKLCEEARRLICKVSGLRYEAKDERRLN